MDASFARAMLFCVKRYASRIARDRGARNKPPRLREGLLRSDSVAILDSYRSAKRTLQHRKKTQTPLFFETLS